MAKTKKRSAHRAASTARVFPAPTLAPQVLEQAAQGWLQSSGTAFKTPHPRSTQPDLRLAEALAECLQDLRTDLAEIRNRLERLEKRLG